MHNTETICLPMQIQRFNSTIWSPCCRAEYAMQPRDGYNLSRAQSQSNSVLLSPPLLESYARAIASKGSPLPNCVGLLDGTVRLICRPEQNQRTVCNGHKRVHGMKYQSVVLPNGMIANMYSPVGNSFNMLLFLGGGGDLEALYPYFTN